MDEGSKCRRSTYYSTPALDEALIVAENLPATAGVTLIEMAQTAFDKSFVVVLATATIILFVAAFMIRFATHRTKVRENKHYS